MANTQVGVGSLPYGLELMQPLNENAPFITLLLAAAFVDMDRIGARRHPKSDRILLVTCPAFFGPTEA